MAMTSNFQRNKDGSLKTVNGKQVPPHLVLLRIPPAWTEVMVDPNPTATSLAKGLDAAGRTQRVYVGSFLEGNKMDKFKRIRQLLLEWDDIRTQIEKDVNSSGDVEWRQASVVAYLIYETAIRPGSEKDTKAAVRAYGALTLIGRHVTGCHEGVRLRFVGKKGVSQDVTVTNPWLTEYLMACIELEDNPIFNVRPSVLAKYFATLGSGQFTPKDLRTARATKLAIDLVGQSKLPVGNKERKAFLSSIMEKVAKKLGNTKQVAKSAYVDPEAVEEILK